MEDREIIALYMARSETAISKTAEQYGKYCHCIAWNILHNDQDSEECVNDTYLRAWNRIPPQNPSNLGTFLGKITRNLALDKLKYDHRQKRGGGQVVLALEELDGCLPAGADVEQAVSERALRETLNAFLRQLPPKKRQIFLRRYWYFSSIEEIAGDFGISQSNAKVMLLRTRRELKRFLEKEGVML